MKWSALSVEINYDGNFAEQHNKDVGKITVALNSKAMHNEWSIKMLMISTKRPWLLYSNVFKLLTNWFSYLVWHDVSCLSKNKVWNSTASSRNNLPRNKFLHLVTLHQLSACCFPKISPIINICSHQNQIMPMFHHEIMITEIFDPIQLRIFFFFSFFNRSSLPPRKKKDFFDIVIYHHITPSCLTFIPIQSLFFFSLAAQLSKLLQNKAKNPRGAHKSHCNKSLPSDTGETGSPTSGKGSGKWLNF